jgi:hypothetical protein
MIRYLRLKFRKILGYLNYYTSNHAYTEYSFIKLFFWKIGVFYRLIGESKKNSGSIFINLQKRNYRHKLINQKPALICATGPSLNELNSNFLDNFKVFGDIFSINYFPLTSIASKCLIDYHLILDTKQLSEIKHNDSITPLKCWIKNEFNGKLITWSGSKIDFDGEVIYIKAKSAPSFSRSINPMRNIVGFHPYTTLFAISTAIWLGYKPIYVTGLDASQHAFIEMDGNIPYLKAHHVEGFYPNNEGRWGGRKDVRTILSSNAYVVEQMKLFKRNEIFIVGEVSQVDVLNRVKPDEILKNHKN